MKKYSIPAGGLLVLALLFLLESCFISHENILGRWENQNGLILEVTDTHLSLQGISFPYEMKAGGSFIMDGGALGPLSGQYRLKDGRLYLTVGDHEDIFFRA